MTLQRINSVVVSSVISHVIMSYSAEGLGNSASRRGSNSMLFLRHVPNAPSDLEGLYASTTSHMGRARSQSEGKEKIKPLSGKYPLALRTRIFIRRALETIWPFPSKESRTHGGDKTAIDGDVQARSSGTSRRILSPSYRLVGRGVRVGPLLAHSRDVPISGRSERWDAGAGQSRLPSIEKISINMTRNSPDSCPVDLIAPCAVPSASLKEYGVLREEGLVVPSAFLVGDVVEFVSRMSKLDRYSDRRTSKSLERIFVTDCGRLVGYVTSMDLLVRDREAPLLSVVRSCEVIINESDEYDDAIMAMRAKRLTYAPVVNENNIVTGIITPSDMMEEMEQEATDDVSRFSGSGGGESYFGTSLIQLVTARAWWLVSLLMLQSLSSIILTHFQPLIERHLVIALFLTMLTGTAGNAGNQSSAMVIRGLATGEISRKNGWRVILRELKAACLMSVLLAIASFIRVWVTPGSNLMSTITISVAMSVTVIGACFLGTFAPLILDRLGLDPCNCASPALATMTDVGGVLVLCAISSAMLG